MSLNQLLIIPFSLLFIVLVPSTASTQKTYDDKQIEVSLRKIGDEVLLAVGDSTSRVLPIIKSSNRYKIELDTKIEFNPDVLVGVVNRTLVKTKLAENFIVEVEQCEDGKIVYSYEMKSLDTLLNAGHCSARTLPLSCYNILVSLNPLETPFIGMQASLNPTLVSSEDKSDSNTMFIGILGLVSIAIILFFIFKHKSNSDKSVDPNVIQLGVSRFDKHNTELIIEDRRIELTAKEADLLILLYDAVNTTIEREVILSKVWGDEGDYVGRTLDVFISKLRKKLEADKTVKIVNIRGVGYKLVARV